MWQPAPIGADYACAEDPTADGADRISTDTYDVATATRTGCCRPRPWRHHRLTPSSRALALVARTRIQSNAVGYRGTRVCAAPDARRRSTAVHTTRTDTDDRTNRREIRMRRSIPDGRLASGRSRVGRTAEGNQRSIWCGIAAAPTYTSMWTVTSSARPTGKIYR